jgi:hypothetical protein
MNRERWLQRALDELEVIIKRHGYTAPPCHVSTGFPSSKGLSNKRKALGECWHPDVSSDTRSHIFVNPTLHDPTEALATLLHEMIHATVGIEHKHRGEFATLARACGLDGKLTATYAGEELQAELQVIADRLGEYPHPEFNPAQLTRQKSDKCRMLKVSCPSCGYTARIARKWIDVGLPTCACGEKMEAPE